MDRRNPTAPHTFGDPWQPLPDRLYNTLPATDPDVFDPKTNRYLPGQVDYMKRASQLAWINGLAALFHFIVAGIAFLLVFIYKDHMPRAALYTDFGQYQPFAKPFIPNADKIASYFLFAVVLPVSAIAGIFHAVLTFTPYVHRWYTTNALLRGTNVFRWLEYSITGTLVVWTIAHLSGVTNVFLLGLLAVANIAACLYAFVHEQHLHMVRDQLARMTAGTDGARLGKLAESKWVPLMASCIPLMAIWAAILVYFVYAVKLSTTHVPIFIWVSVIGAAAVSLLVPVWLFVYTLGWPKFTRNKFYYECVFIAISAVLKTLFTMAIIAGSVANRNH